MRTWEIQRAIVTRLQAQASLLAMVEGVYDHVPQNVDPPFIVIGDSISASDDTDDDFGTSSLERIHTWSRYRGRKETKQIQQEIYAALHRAELVVDAASMVSCVIEGEENFLDADGLTRHGVQQCRISLDEVQS